MITTQDVSVINGIAFNNCYCRQGLIIRCVLLTVLKLPPSHKLTPIYRIWLPYLLFPHAALPDTSIFITLSVYIFMCVYILTYTHIHRYKPNIRISTYNCPC